MATRKTSTKETPTVTAEKATRKPRTPSPYTAVKKAKAELERAQKAAQKVADVTARLEKAKAEYDEAVEALQRDLGVLDVSTDTVE